MTGTAAGPGRDRATAPPLPVGFSVALDRSTAEVAPGAWLGGHPRRVMTLTPRGRSVWAELANGPVDSTASGLLARRLTDGGLAHPVPPRSAGLPDVTVVVPVFERAEALDRCLTSLGGRFPVVVVDDASPDPAEIRAIAERHGARLVRREVNGGPGAARDTGLATVRSDLVAFVDSDTVAGGEWISALAGHLTDPAVAVVAPRVAADVSASSNRVAARSALARCCLDLGPNPARVAPYTPVSYVPAAALLARVSTLRGIADRDGHVFDPALRVGEDVDLIWRLVEAGWRVRYDPSVRIPHVEPASWSGLVRRRARYGRSAAALAQRHPANVAPLVVHPWSAAVVGAVVARRPSVAAVAFAGASAAAARRRRRAGLSGSGATRAAGAGCVQTWRGLAHYATRFGSPALLFVIARRRRGAAIATALLLTPALTDLVAARRTRPDADRVGAISHVLAHVVDDVAYGTGVLIGCCTHRTAVPLRPVLTK